MYCTADNLVTHTGNDNLSRAAAINVNPDAIDTRGPRRWLESNEIAAKGCQIDRAYRVFYLELRDVTTGGE
jgi:hypothetical protein